MWIAVLAVIGLMVLGYFVIKFVMFLAMLVLIQVAFGKL